MREKPGNLFLLVLAICTLVDVIAARPDEEGDFIISIGVFGALLSRAFLEEPQPLMLCVLGLFLTVYSIVGNHGIVDTLSGGLYLVFLLLAVAYALWEKLLRWFSL